jgi:hypothetical protein
VVLASALAATGVGFLAGVVRGPNADYSAWEEVAATAGIIDLAGFVRVAYIHNASYIGALIGLLAAIAWLRRLKPRNREPGERDA